MRTRNPPEALAKSGKEDQKEYASEEIAENEPEKPAQQTEDGNEEIEDSDVDRDDNGATENDDGEQARQQEPQGDTTSKENVATAPRKWVSKKERRARKIQRRQSAVIKEYKEYTQYDYEQAARRFDMVYGSAEMLYQLAKESKASRVARARELATLPTVSVEAGGKLLVVEDPTFGLYVPPPDETMTRDERRARDENSKKRWLERERERRITSLQYSSLAAHANTFK